MPLDPQADAVAVPDQSTPYRWHQKMAGLLYTIFCFEVGVFLVVLPWSHYWDFNYFSFLGRAWSSAYLRGAVTGLGLVDLYVALVEVFALRRFSSGPRELE